MTLQPFPAELILLACLVGAVVAYLCVVTVAEIVDRYRDWR